MTPKKILLVEDNPNDAELAILALKSKGVVNKIDHVVDGQIDGYNFGANSYIRKPVDANKFNDAISQLKMYWLLLNKLLPDLYKGESSC